MSIEVTLAEPKVRLPSKGSAGLSTQVSGVATTVSGVMEASKAIGNGSLIKKGKG